MENRGSKNSSDERNIELQTPWSRFARGSISRQSCLYPANKLPTYSIKNLPGDASDKVSVIFIEERTRLHETFIKETEITKRYALVLSALLLALACLVPVFAPAGREAFSYVVSAGLFIFAAGAAGYTSISFKDSDHQLTASSGPENSD